jgi:hypothetical protein
LPSPEQRALPGGQNRGKIMAGAETIKRSVVKDDDYLLTGLLIQSFGKSNRVYEILLSGATTIKQAISGVRPLPLS